MSGSSEGHAPCKPRPQEGPPPRLAIEPRPLLCPLQGHDPLFLSVFLSEFLGLLAAEKGRVSWFFCLWPNCLLLGFSDLLFFFFPPGVLSET